MAGGEGKRRGADDEGLAYIGVSIDGPVRSPILPLLSELSSMFGIPVIDEKPAAAAATASAAIMAHAR